MKKIIALFATMAVVLSLTCVCMAANNKGPSCGAQYNNYRMKAWVTAPEDRSNYQYYAAVELWNGSGRFPANDKIVRGMYNIYTARTKTADSGKNKNSTCGYAVMYLKDDYGKYVKEATRSGKFYY